MGAEDKAIECEICKEWFHTGCADLTDNEYEVLSTHKIGTIHWYCATCNVKSVELLRLVFGLQHRLQKSEHETASLKRETHAKFSKLDSEYEAVSEDLKTLNQLECGPMPNVMVALPNIGGALCSTPQSLADAHY